MAAKPIRLTYDTTTAIEAMFDTYTKANPGGGSLHIVLEDGNCGRDHVEFCRTLAIAEKDWLGAVLADVLLQLRDEDLADLESTPIADVFAFYLLETGGGTGS
jgi:hypothetical protein